MPNPKSQSSGNQAFFKVCLLGTLMLTVGCYIRFIFEEIVPFYPLYTDQGYYLRAAYEYFEYGRSHGFLSLLKAHFLHDYSALGFTSASSLHMSLLASLLFPVVGANRLGALSILIFSWFALLITSAFVFKKITKNWAYSAWIVGLLLGTRFCFIGPGGMADFRMDFPAACWSGVAILLWCLFLQFPSSKYAWMASTITFGLFLFRILTLVYWGPVLLALFLHSAWEYKKRRSTQFQSLWPAMITLGCAVLVLIVWDWSFIYHYYFVAQKEEAPLRRQAMGLLNSGLGAFLFYPKNLWNYHFGNYAKIELLFSGACILIFSLKKIVKDKLKIFSCTSCDRKILFFVSSLIFWPIFVLFMNALPASQVAGIAIPPLVFACGIIVVIATKQIGLQFHRFLTILGGVTLFFGFACWQQQLVRSTPFQGKAKTDAIRFNQILEKIAFYETSLQKKDAEPLSQVAYLDWKEGFDHNSVTLYARERLHLDLSFEMEVPRTIFHKTEQELLASLKKANAIILPKDGRHLKDVPWPIMKSIGNSYETLANFITHHFFLADEFQNGLHDYQLYLAYKIQVISPWPDWLPPQGAYLKLPPHFPKGRTIELRGQWSPELTSQAITIVQDFESGRPSVKYQVPVNKTKNNEYSAKIKPLLPIDRFGTNLHLIFQQSLPLPRPNGDSRKLALPFPMEVQIL